MMTNSPIFIVGYQKSGTTLLYRTLTSHPAFIFTQGKAETELFKRPDYLLMFDDHIRQEFYDVMNNDEKSVFGHKNFRKSREACLKFISGKSIGMFYSGIIDLIQKNLSLARKGIPLNPNIGDAREIWRTREYENLIRSFFRFVAVSNEGKRIIEKTPDHYLYHREIKICFDDAIIIFIVRDPVEIYASLCELKKGFKDKEQNIPKWLKVDCDRFIGGIRRLHHTMIECEKLYKEDVIVVNYKNLTSDPINTIRYILDRVGERNKDKKLLNEMMKAKYVDETDIFLKKPIMTYCKRPADLLGKPEIDKIQNELENIYVHWGIERQY